MSLNSTPSGERVHIGFFGKRNAGKSSLVNAVTGQDLAVVSDTKGTTTDPVYKAMELLPIGPVMIIDTPGYDDEGELGHLRVRKTKQILNKSDMAILVVDATEGIGSTEEELLNLFEEKEIPYLIVYNKSELLSGDTIEVCQANPYLVNKPFMMVSAKTGKDIDTLKEKMATLVNFDENKKVLVGDLIQPNDLIVLVIPIDSAAPKGRLILPQQQVIRDILDHGASAICVRETELETLFNKLGQKPAMVITDSQAFQQVAAIVPQDVLLTSFSILLARYKGLLDTAVKGVWAIDSLKDGDKVLMAEGCSHHRQCDDIGTVKIPRWLKAYTGKNLEISTCSGREFPEDLSEYALVIHCGGCMIGEKEVKYRMKCALDQGIPITNYGITIAFMKGILSRSIQVFESDKNTEH